MSVSEQPDQVSSSCSGSLLGSASLIAGTMIGAGIIALPAKTIAAGFAPSVGAIFVAWAFMVSSALLIAEVNLETCTVSEQPAVSLSSMVSETLGPAGARLNGAVYLFIHYTVLVAYLLQGGALASDLLLPLLNLQSSAVPASAATSAFTLAVGGSLLAASPRDAERANTALVFGVVASFAALLAVGLPQVDPSFLTHSDTPAVVGALPVVTLSLVFHNVVPTVCAQLGCDIRRIRIAIMLGSAAPALMLVAWSAVVLGTVPATAAAAAATAVPFDPLQALRAEGDALGGLVSLFSLLAVSTSVIGFIYGLADFWADALGWEATATATGAAPTEPGQARAKLAAVAEAPPQRQQEQQEPQPQPQQPFAQKSALYALVLAPPLAIALWDPSLFFAALDAAGTYGVLVLFGLVPVAMAWQQRYAPGADPAEPDALPGGRATLVAMAVAAGSVIGVETWERVLQAAVV